ncbi:glucokinase [Motilibacter rhizosphaerae]|uniref:Glucokinase n=1 Tax=Motilibacter rhizosphaerae TaxID=598652 RepID=A0A4Q7NG95_9ACTN|nr:glucokinase [Motilibacter rhizosphaerae]
MTVGVDVGGTKTAVALVGLDGVVHDERRNPTAGSAEDGLALVAKLIAEWQGEFDVLGVGLATPGLVRGGVLESAANLSGWAGVAVGPLLADLTGRPVLVDNDGRAAAWGEFLHGAAVPGSSDLLCLTLGTGLGGGLVLQGRPYRGGGLAGEVGHMVLVPDGRLCGCGACGCWERYVSGSALVEEAHGLGMRAAPGRALDGRSVVAAARQGDPAASTAVHNVARSLGEGLAVVVTLLDPQTVVLAGGLSAAGDLLLPEARRALAETVIGGRTRHLPPLRTAALGSRAGVVGAAALAREAA